jgi:hypothetical protein
VTMISNTVAASARCLCSGQEWGPDDAEAVREVVAAQSANSTPHQERRTPNMTTVAHRIRAAILILALSLAGCSGGGARSCWPQASQWLLLPSASGTKTPPWCSRRPAT